MSEVTVSMKLTPKQAGALYVKHLEQFEEIKKLKAQLEEMKRLATAAAHGMAATAKEGLDVTKQLEQVTAERDSALAQLAAIQAKAAKSGTWLRDSNVNGGKRQSEVK